MPKIGVVQKTTRDRAIIGGLDELFAGRSALTIRQERHTRASLAAKFEKHLQQMARVRQLTTALRAAVREERRQEALLRPFVRALKSLAAAQAGGAREAGMRDYGFEPDRKPVPERSREEGGERQAPADAQEARHRRQEEALTRAAVRSRRRRRPGRGAGGS